MTFPIPATTVTGRYWFGSSTEGAVLQLATQASSSWAYAYTLPNAVMAPLISPPSKSQAPFFFALDPAPSTCVPFGASCMFRWQGKRAASSGYTQLLMTTGSLVAQLSFNTGGPLSLTEASDPEQAATLCRISTVCVLGCSTPHLLQPPC